MMRARGAAALLAALLLAGADAARAQDSLIVRPDPLPVDTTRLAPFFRTYDIIVHRGDSSIVVGRRSVGVLPGTYAGVDAWRLVERRTGAVPAVDSLWLSTAVRPLYWSSALGPGVLTGQFVSDSLFGSVAYGRASLNIVLEGRPDLLVNGAMTEMVLGLLPLDATWSDSAALLEVDPSGARVVPAELVVVAEETVMTDPMNPRRAWVVAVRTAGRQLLYWVDAETGATLRVQQNLPAHIGDYVEYRAHPSPRIRLPLFWP